MDGSERHAAASEHHDVLIVGGGPVGLCMAILLAQAGVDVLVLEARSERVAHSRAIGIHPPGQRVLARAGVSDALVAAGVQIGEGIARSRGSDVARLCFDRPVLAVPQWRTEEALEARLHELAPGALRRGVRAVRAERGRRGAVVLCESGEDLAARWVVAADGARSALRGSLGVPVHGRRLPDAYFMGDFADATGDGPRAVLHLEPGGIVESFPLPDGARRWVVHLDEPETDPTPSGLAQLIAARTRVRVDPSTCTMLSAFTVGERLAARMSVGHVLLVGDAAHEVSPIGGQGMTLGWLDAEAFAPLIAWDVRRAALVAADAGPADIDWPELWAAAERERLRAVALAARQARLNMALGRPLPAGVMAARNAAFRAIYRVPWLGERTARRFTMQA